MKRTFQYALCCFLFLSGTWQLAFTQCGPGEDTTPPNITCNNEVFVNLGANPPSNLGAFIFLETYNDNCTDYSDALFEASFDGLPFEEVLQLFCENAGNTYDVTFQATDEQGNASTCQSSLVIDDLDPPLLACDAEINVSIPLGAPYVVTPETILEGALDNCILEFSQVGFIDGPLSDTLLLTCEHLGDHFVRVQLVDGPGQGNQCWTSVIVEPGAGCEQVTLEGNLFIDENDNCLFDSGEPPLGAWMVAITNTQYGNTQTIPTDLTGSFSWDQNFFDPTMPNANFEVTLPNVPPGVLACGYPVTIPAPIGGGTVSVDLPVQLETDCMATFVDIGTNAFRPCLDSYIQVQYCNFSDELVENATVEVVLDEDLTFISSSIVGTGPIGNTYAFALGDLPPGFCGSFSIQALVSCSVSVGQTLCLEAFIEPYEDCDPGSPGWTGASIDVESDCDGSEVKFKIKNIGTGAMSESQNYIIVEDVVMYMSNPFELGPGEEVEVSVPANGSTWRMEAAQEPGHPGSFQPVAWMEGCGGINQAGLINAFPVNNTNPYQVVFCLEATQAYDPNDKQGFPLGLTQEHYIEPNQKLDYMVRFQNTGNDTAFTVVIADTLSSHLDPSTLRPGVSSHPYEFEADGAGAFRFVFNDILLPDSTTNFDGSQGFVKFEVEQVPDLPEGTEIFNTAFIYFDFNDPVLTNQTVHRIKEDVISILALPEIGEEALQFHVLPNPFSGTALVELDTEVQRGRLQVMDLLGRVVVEQAFSGRKTELNGESLMPGVYLLHLSENGAPIGTAKLVVR